MIAPHKFNFSEQYSQTSRLLLLDKLGVRNTNACPLINSAYASIELRKLTDFDDSRLIAAMFILRLLSGSRPYISRFGLFQTFYTRAYDVSICVNMGCSLAESLLTVLAERIFPFLAKADFSSNYIINKNGILVAMTISDLSFVRVVETHSVFFRWHDKVKLDFTFKNTTRFAVDLLLNSYKI